MEKRFFAMLALMLSAVAFTSCEYDDSGLWDKLNSLQEQVTANQEDIATLTSLVEALNKGKVIVATTQTDNGYTLTFSDGSTIEITNGKDGDSFFVSIVEQDDMVIITLADGRVIKLPVINYELRVLTFEDEDAKFEPYTFLDCQGTSYSISTWSDLIPALDYGDYMIYDPEWMGRDSEYNWSDAGNTNLSHAFPETSRGKTYNASGHVLSKSYTREYEKYGSYSTELYVYADGAHSGANCCIHHGYTDSGRDLTLPSIEFEDGVARVVDHMWVANTAYVYYNIYKGHGFGSSYQNGPSDTSWFKITAYGYDSATDAEPTEVEFYLLAEGKKFVTDWTKWDLTPLGKVLKVEFNITGSDDMVSAWGLGSPAYFAYDDVAVRFEK